MIDAVVSPRRMMRRTAAEDADAVAPGAAEMVRSHWQQVRRYLRILGADAAQADDLAQDTFVVALQKGIDDRGAPTAAWLRRTARNLFCEQVRRRRTVELDVAEVVFEQEADDDGGRRRALRACLPLLTERGQTAIRLAYGERQSWAQIAAVLDMQASGVKTLLRRCRDTLRQCIERSIEQEGS